MIHINWLALGEVTVVTFFSTLLLIGIVSLAARLLDRLHHRTISGLRVSPRYKLASQSAAYALLTIAGAIIVFGFWLIVPWWH